MMQTALQLKNEVWALIRKHLPMLIQRLGDALLGWLEALFRDVERLLTRVRSIDVVEA